MNNPLTSWRRNLWLTVGSGAALLLPCAVWSFAPIAATQTSDLPSLEFNAPNSSDSPDTPTTKDPPPTSPVLNSNVFAVTLWHAPPPAPPPPSEVATNASIGSETSRKVEPLKLQLVAIIEVGGTRQAALYDQINDRIVIITDGGTIRDRAVRVKEKVVEFSTSDGREREHLLLRPDENSRNDSFASGNT